MKKGNANVHRRDSLRRRTVLAVLLLSAGTLGDACPEQGRTAAAGGRAHSQAAALGLTATSSPPAAPTFEATVRPILASRCAPCHNPGGKKYAELPFDQPDVVSSHAGGIRRRLKGEDLQALEKWLATLPPQPAS